MADQKRGKKPLTREGWGERLGGAMGEIAGDVGMGMFTPMLKSDALRALVSKYGNYLKALVRLLTSFLPEVQGETIEGIVERAIVDLQRQGVDPGDNAKVNEVAKGVWEKIKSAAGSKKPDAVANNSNAAEALADLEEEELARIEASLIAAGDDVLPAFKMTAVTAKALRGIARIENEGLRTKLFALLKAPAPKPEKDLATRVAEFFGIKKKKPEEIRQGGDPELRARAERAKEHANYNGEPGLFSWFWRLIGFED